MTDVMPSRPSQSSIRTSDPDELAFAFCFDVLASLGSMTLEAISSLLAPWGWTRDSLLGRLNALQDDGLLMLGHTDRPGKKPIPHVSVTSQGKKLSEGRGLYSHRQRPGHETDGSPNQPARGAAPRGERPRARLSNQGTVLD
jgi:hypothetical protein